jgi:YggT family protein
VPTVLAALDAFIGVLRTVLFGGGALVAALAALSYAVRTRKVSPFSSVARLTRDSIDPLFAPVEKRVVRAGGRPATAPWWTLAALVVLGIVVITVLGFVRQQLAMATVAMDMGARGIGALLVSWTFGILQLALLVRVFSSWFQMSPYSPWIRWAFALTDWLLTPLRNVIPALGMIDVTPIVAYFLLTWVLEPLFLTFAR